VVDWFKGADKDGDGKLTLAEFQADAERFFHVLDINKDGVIDHREIYYYEHKICPEMLGLAYSARLDDGRPKLWLAQFGQRELAVAVLVRALEPVDHRIGGGRLGAERFAHRADEQHFRLIFPSPTAVTAARRTVLAGAGRQAERAGQKADGKDAAIHIE
jgi:hypothetical protein